MHTAQAIYGTVVHHFGILHYSITASRSGLHATPTSLIK